MSGRDHVMKTKFFVTLFCKFSYSIQDCKHHISCMLHMVSVMKYTKQVVKEAQKCLEATLKIQMLYFCSQRLGSCSIFTVEVAGVNLHPPSGVGSGGTNVCCWQTLEPSVMWETWCREKVLLSQEQWDMEAHTTRLLKKIVKVDF